MLSWQERVWQPSGTFSVCCNNGLPRSIMCHFNVETLAAVRRTCLGSTCFNNGWLTSIGYDSFFLKRTCYNLLGTGRFSSILHGSRVSSTNGLPRSIMTWVWNWLIRLETSILLHNFSFWSLSMFWTQFSFPVVFQGDLWWKPRWHENFLVYDFYSACWWCWCPNTIINIDTKSRIKVDFIPIVQKVLRRFLISLKTLNSYLLAFSRCLLAIHPKTSSLAWQTRVGSGCTAHSYNCRLSLCNSRTNCYPYEVLDEWTPSLSFIIVPQIVLFHHFDVVLLMRVLVFAEVNRFLVQRPIEQLEILQTSHFFCCLLNQSCQMLMFSNVFLTLLLRKRLLRVVLQDSVLYVIRKIAHLASILRGVTSDTKKSRWSSRA